MPFYLTNENIEATMERNPDDIFNPSDINYKPSSRNIKIRECIAKEIKKTFEKHTEKQVLLDVIFTKVDSFKEDMGLSYLFSFETDNEEYEIIYHISLKLLEVLSQDNQKLFLNLSTAIVVSLEELELTFLQDIELMNLSEQIVTYDKKETLKNLYSYSIFIDNKEYILYLQLDNQFNKMF